MRDVFSSLARTVVSAPAPGGAAPGPGHGGGAVRVLTSQCVERGGGIMWSPDNMSPTRRDGAADQSRSSLHHMYCLMVISLSLMSPD